MPEMSLRRQERPVFEGLESGSPIFSTSPDCGGNLSLYDGWRDLAPITGRTCVRSACYPAGIGRVVCDG